MSGLTRLGMWVWPLCACEWVTLLYLSLFFVCGCILSFCFCDFICVFVIWFFCMQLFLFMLFIFVYILVSFFSACLCDCCVAVHHRESPHNLHTHTWPGLDFTVDAPPDLEEVAHGNTGECSEVPGSSMLYSTWQLTKLNPAELLRPDIDCMTMSVSVY